MSADLIPLVRAALDRSDNTAKAATGGRNLMGGKRGTLEERLWAKVEKTAGCWLFTGSLNSHGYGSLWSGEGGTVRAHRVAYELLVGPIPNGLTLDHLCRVRHCVRPDHLEPVTNAVNVARGTAISVTNAQKTHCEKGHEFTPENTAVHPAGGGRRCRACHKEVERLSRVKRRDGRPPRSYRGHSVVAGEQGWHCKCGVPLATTRAQAHDVMRFHRLELWMAEPEQQAALAAALGTTEGTT